MKYIYVCRSKEYITITSKNISINQHFPINKYLYGHSIEHKIISVWEYMVYYLSLLQDIPLYA